MKIRIEKTTNYTEYFLLDDHGCVAARVSSKNYAADFCPNLTQVLAAFKALIPATPNVIITLDQTQTTDQE